jgi:hypothetical protein
MRTRAATKASKRRASPARRRGPRTTAATPPSALLPLVRVFACLGFVFAVGSGLWSPLAELGAPSPIGQGILAAAAAIVVGWDGATIRSWLRRPAV